MSCLSESFLSAFPAKRDRKFLSEVFLPKLLRLKVFDLNVLSIDKTSAFKTISKLFQRFQVDLIR